MKYTRYDFKRKKSENKVIIVVLLSILLIAFFLGTFISNIIMKKTAIQTILPDPNSKTAPVNSKENKSCKFIVIQGGKFAKIENLELVKKLLTDYGTPFTIEEQNGTRVLLGVYNEDESLKIINELKTKNIDNSKIIFEMQLDNLCNEELAAIINAELEVVNKLSDKGIKSIQTDELKNWANGLEKVNSKDANSKVLEDYKSHINTLPKELNINNAVDIEVYLYNLLRKITNK